MGVEVVFVRVKLLLIYVYCWFVMLSFFVIVGRVVEMIVMLRVLRKRVRYRENMVRWCCYVDIGGGMKLVIWVLMLVSFVLLVGDEVVEEEDVVLLIILLMVFCCFLVGCFVFELMVVVFIFEL